MTMSQSRKGLHAEEGKGTDKGPWHDTVDLIMHYRCVDASARHGLVSFSVSNVDMD